jgi:hypothetical protein
LIACSFQGFSYICPRSALPWHDVGEAGDLWNDDPGIHKNLLITWSIVHNFAAAEFYLWPLRAEPNAKARKPKTSVMKKIVLCAAALVAFATVSAQTVEITSNRGENWLSQSGDWGLTFDANPLLNYAGNLFNNTEGNSIGNGLTYPDQQMIGIMGKKLIDANTAYRGMVRIGFGSNSSTSLVQQAGQSDPEVTVENVTKVGNFDLLLGGGLEKRVGSSRVVGIYGAEAYIMLGSGKTTYDYGNAITNENQQGGNPRTTEEKQGGTFGFGMGVFGGVEWFCAPKVSLSGEYTWGLMLASTGFGETTTERWDATANNNAGALVTTTTEGPTGKTSNFSLDTGVSGARIGINFYFQ